MDPRRGIWENCFLGKELSLRSSVSVITRHVVYALVLWCFDDRWHVSCESKDNREEGVVADNVAPEPGAVLVQLEGDGSVPAPLMSTVQPGDVPNFPVRFQATVPSAFALTPEQLSRLNSPGAVNTANFQTPTGVYVGVPFAFFFVAFCSIYCYCSWKKNLRKNRNKIIEKVAEKHRIASIKPGSPIAKELAKQAAKMGLSERSGKSEHDAAALITFSASITGLAVELETVEQTVLDYQSYNAGEAIPEFHKLDVEGEHFSVSINPLFNSLQSGACGHVLSGKKTPFIRFTDERRTSVPFMLENSLYLAPPPPPDGEHSDEEHEEEDHDEDHEEGHEESHDEDHEEDHEEGHEESHEGESSAGATEATSVSWSGGASPSSDNPSEEIKPEGEEFSEDLSLEHANSSRRNELSGRTELRDIIIDEDLANLLKYLPQLSRHLQYPN